MPNTRKDNKKPRIKRTVITRKIARNILRNRIGSNKIQEAWHKFQLNKRAII